MEDKIVTEVREIRRKLEAEFDNDLQTYANDLYERQKQHGEKLVRGSPKPSKKRNAA